jgi:hypothetical protein
VLVFTVKVLDPVFLIKESVPTEVWLPGGIVKLKLPAEAVISIIRAA